MIGGYLRTTSCLAMIAAAGIAMGGVSAQAADLGGNCCADLEERVAELEATTARKGNRKVSLQIYGQVSESVIWWNDGAESNTYVQENNAIQNRLGVQGSAKINSDWSAGYKLEMQIRAYRSSAANQLSLGASNNVTIPAYNTQSITIREANWYLRSNTYGTITVGRTADAAVGTGSISLVNPDGFAGPNAGMANAGFFLRRAGTVGNAGLSGRTWGNTAFLPNGDGPFPFDYATTNSQVKYTSPFFLGQTKSSGFQFSANWGADDAWATALRYVEDFGTFRFAAGASFAAFSNPDRTSCVSSNNENAANPTGVGGGGFALAPTPRNNDDGNHRCEAIQASASLMHVPTGLYVSGVYSQQENSRANLRSAMNVAGISADQQASVATTSSMWWLQAGWQAKLNPLGSTIFWGQYVEFNGGVNVAGNVIQTVAAADVLNSLGNTAFVRSATTTAWGLGVSQNIDAAAMTLYAGFHNISTDITLGSTTTAARAKTNPIDDMQVFYTGATIRF